MPTLRRAWNFVPEFRVSLGEDLRRPRPILIHLYTPVHLGKTNGLALLAPVGVRITQNGP